MKMKSRENQQDRPVREIRLAEMIPVPVAVEKNTRNAVAHKNN
jgi:hypothetical protein